MRTSLQIKSEMTQASNLLGINLNICGGKNSAEATPLAESIARTESPPLNLQNVIELINDTN